MAYMPSTDACQNLQRRYARIRLHSQQRWCAGTALRDARGCNKRPIYMLNNTTRTFKYQPRPGVVR
ncbi:hypothetical protein PISMIDRAFT_671387 [Pisolithus microcarpus 441]|uniref:Unplaced genomic scaffold scaffold_3, whole genome shotgun sequence n=1 Tax=Pisolithus microcarpus 441 TaxID=765257 RepID=A0A0D0ADS3_9AGAM|nr:hypothetical protein PISMIDRAFT_671387 [Pisolithus microcarpus 441]